MALIFCLHFKKTLLISNLLHMVETSHLLLLFAVLGVHKHLYALKKYILGKLGQAKPNKM